MPPTIEPQTPDPARLRFAIVVSRFNEEITGRLLAGAVEAFTAAGVPEANLTVVWVPGAFELPLVSQELLEQQDLAAVVALGCVIRGETSHYDHVCNEAARGLMNVGLAEGVPVIFGVLTTEDGDQARARAGGPKGNKGADAAAAALEMCGLLAALRDG